MTEDIALVGDRTWRIGRCRSGEAFGRYLMCMKFPGEAEWQIWAELPIEYFEAEGITTEHENYFGDAEIRALFIRLNIEWVSNADELPIRNSRFKFNEGPNPRHKKPFRKAPRFE